MSSPITYHAINVRIESAITVGTNTLLTRSASRCTGALVDCASRTSLVICANVESAPTRRARTTNRPVKFTVVPVTLLPTCTSTGTLSPVSVDASMLDAPSITTPSAAIISPGRTTIMSPTRINTASIVVSSPSRKIVAVRAPNASNARNASPARRFARASKYRPANKKMVTATATSKYTCMPPLMLVIEPCTDEFAASPHTRAHTDHDTAATIPSEISVSIVVERCRAFINAARWKGHAPQVTTGADNASANHCQFANCSIENIETSATGRPKAMLAVRRDLSMATRSRTSASNMSGVVSASDRAP